MKRVIFAMLRTILGKDIAPYVRRHHRLLISALALTALASVFVLIPAYLLKPFTDQVLVDSINRVMAEAEKKRTV